MLRGEKVTLRAIEREDMETLWRFWNDLEVELAGGGDPPLPVSVERLRAMGLEDERCFCRYHRVLSRAVWSGKEASRILLELLMKARRRSNVSSTPITSGASSATNGKKIEAKGIYRDPVRYSHSHLVKTSALRFLIEVRMQKSCIALVK